MKEADIQYTKYIREHAVMVEREIGAIEEGRISGLRTSGWIGKKQRKKVEY